MTEKKTDFELEIDVIVEAIFSADLTVGQAVEAHSVLVKECADLEADEIATTHAQTVLNAFESIFENHYAATKSAAERAREEFECAQEEAAESAIED